MINKKDTLISCLPVSLFQQFFDRKMDIVQWSEYAADLGMDAIDLNRRCLLDMTVPQVEDAAKRLALPVMMVTTYSDFTDPDPEELHGVISAAKEDIVLAAALNAKYIRLTTGQAYPDQKDEEALARIRQCFEACIPVAESAGVRLLLENHSKPGAWQYPDYDFHLERMLKLWEALKDLPIGINFDTANAYALKDWRSLVGAFGNRIETVHMNDLESISPLKFSCVGEGIVPQTDILREVYRQGFAGPICIEEASMQGTDGIAKAFSHTKAILRQLAGPMTGIHART